MTKAKNTREGFTLVTVSATGIVLAPSMKSSYRGKISLEFNMAYCKNIYTSIIAFGSDEINFFIDF